MKYDKISKSKMLKNKYGNNILSYYKKPLLSIIFAVTTITLSIMLVLNLMKIKEVETRPQIIIFEETSDEININSKELKENNPDIEFKFIRRVIDDSEYYYEYGEYNLQIVQFWGNAKVVVKRTCIFIDEKGVIQNSLYGYEFTNDNIQEWIDYYGW